MPTIGRDCELILDGTGYFSKPGSFQCKQPRIRHIAYRADGSLSYVDHGPGKRTWTMIILAYNELIGYDGNPLAYNGQQLRDTLYQSYVSHIGVAIAFTGPLNTGSIPVYFDNYTERIPELRSLLTPLATAHSVGLTYEISIDLLEA